MRDHPRSRGVYDISGTKYDPRPGSSPLARGLPPRGEPRGLGPGIIPARAGFTGAGGDRGPGQGDHPRSRGVYSKPLTIRISNVGSSPLARGLLSSSSDVNVLIAIIPARAGFTSEPRRPGTCPGDHPRSRGVYQDQQDRRARCGRSSPLARGLHRGQAGGGHRLPIIPARAGFTWPSRPPPSRSGDHPRSRGVYTCGSLVSQRARSLPDPRRLHCRPRARSAGSP